MLKTELCRAGNATTERLGTRTVESTPVNDFLELTAVSCARRTTCCCRR